MQKQLMKVVFKGEVLIGHDVERVKQNLAKKFKLSSLVIERLFSGEPVVVKKNIERQKALKYREAFRQAGAVCTIEWMDPEYVKKQMALSSESSSKIVSCPKCGKKQQKQESCEACGYPLRPSVHNRYNLFTLVYDALRERGVPKWVIIAGLCVIFFGLMVPVFIPRGSREVPVLHDRTTTQFNKASVSDGFYIYHWSFYNKKKIQYDFERIYKKGTLLSINGSEEYRTRGRTSKSISSQGRMTAKMTIKSLGNGKAEIHFTNCERSEEYGMKKFNIFNSYESVKMPDIYIRQLQENGQILSAVSSDFAYLHLLFRTPESLGTIGESEQYEIHMNYQGQQLHGIGEVTLTDYVLVDNHVCAKLIHDMELMSENANLEEEPFEIQGTLTSFIDLDDRILYLGRLKQVITKHSYRMNEGFNPRMDIIQEETITYMKKGLAVKLETEALEE